MEVWLTLLLLPGQNALYFWMHKTYEQPYIGFVDGNLLHHPALLLEKRRSIKILLIDPLQPLPLEILGPLMKDAISLRNTGA